MNGCPCGANTVSGCAYPDLPGADRPAACLALPGAWYESAAVLLAEPDPGPTPWLVTDLIVEQALTAIVGRPKLGKTWALLDLAVSIVAGVPALGRFAVPIPGPVLLIVEESGRAALHRRLSMIARGRAITPDRLAGLHFAANRRVRLDDEEWQDRLREAAQAEPWRLVALDPFARVKGGGTDENLQKDVGPVLDFLRELRDLSGAATGYVHHAGHAEGGRQRGSSDLESYYESKVTITTSGEGQRIEAEHREAEAAGFRFAVRFDGATETVRVEAFGDELEEKVRDYLQEHPDASANDVDEAMKGTKGTSRTKVLQLVKKFKESGSTPVEPLGTTPSESARRVVLSPAPYKGAGTTPATAPDETVPGSENHPEPGLSACIVCERPFVAGEDGSAPLTCPACVARRAAT